MADTSRYFGIGIDTRDLDKGIERGRQGFIKLGEEALRQGKVIDKVFSGQDLSSNMESEFKRLSRLSVEAFGSLSQEAQRAMREMQEDTLSLGNVERMMQGLNKAYEGGEISMREYVNAAARLTVLHEQISGAIQQNEQALRREKQQMDIAGDSIVSMQAKVALLTTEYMRLSEAQRNSVEGEGILKQMSDLQTRLNAAQASMQRFGGAANAQFNMLGMSMQQIVRELPSLAMSPQMFFLAISNNLPVFTDAIAQARKEYKMLTDAGKTATPVWKQIVSSLLSWQTALSALPAILIVLGPRIADFFQSFLTGREKIISATNALNNIHKELESNNANYGENVVALRSLTEEWRRLSGEASQTQWIKDNQSEFDKLGISITDVSDAETVFVDNTDDIIEAFKLRAQAAAAQSLAEEKYREAMIKRNEAELEEAKGPSRSDRILSMTSGVTGPGVSGYQAAGQTVDAKEFFEERVQGLKDEARAAEAAGDAYFELYEAKRLESGQKLSGLGIGDTDNGKKEVKVAKDYLSQLLDLRRDNEERQIDLMSDGSEKQLAEIDLRYKRIRDKVKELEAGLTGQQGGQLTAEQRRLFDDAYSLLDKQQSRDRAGVDDGTVKRLEAARAAMNQYLKDYGTYQQRKLAIAQEYADKIANAQNEGERRSLEAERDKTLSGMETEALRMSIDWPTVFGEFGGMFDSIMEPTLEKIKQYMQTDDFKNLQPADQSEIVEAVNRMEKSLGGAGKVSFKQLGKDVDKLRQSMLDLDDAKNQEAEAIERLKETQEAYEKALESGKDAEIQAASDAKDAAQDNADAASENVKAQEKIVEQNQNLVTSAATTLRSNMENVTQGLQKLASGGIQSAYEGLIQLGKGIGGNKLSKTADSLEDVFIIGWILSILDVLQDGLSDLVGGILDGVFNVVSGIIGDILSGDLFVTLFESITSGIESILDSITFGGFGNLIDKINGSNAKEVNEAIDRLSDRNKALQTSIDALNETIKDARGKESVNAATQAYRYQEEQNANYLEIARQQAGYHSAHHSWRYYMGWSEDWIEWIRENIDAAFSGTDSLWGWTPEQMAKLRENVEIWTAMREAGEGGYGDRVVEKLEDYIDQAGKLEEITDGLTESLTQISFDSMYDSFIDNLMDMEYSAKDAAENISEYFMRAMLSNKIGELYYDKLEDWWKKFGEAMKSDGLDEDEKNALRDEYLGYVNEAIAIRDNLAAATGYDKESSSSQGQPTAGGFETMSQDSADELNGRFTALQMSAEEIKAQINIGNVNLDEIRANTAEFKDIMTGCYNELIDINANTGAIVRPIQQMQRDLTDIRNDIKTRL